MLTKFSAIYCYIKRFLIRGIDSIKYCTMLAWSSGTMINDSWITIDPDILVVNTQQHFGIVLFEDSSIFYIKRLSNRALVKMLNKSAIDLNFLNSG